MIGEDLVIELDVELQYYCFVLFVCGSVACVLQMLLFVLGSSCDNIHIVYSWLIIDINEVYIVYHRINLLMIK